MEGITTMFFLLDAWEIEILAGYQLASPDNHYLIILKESNSQNILEVTTY